MTMTFKLIQEFEVQFIPIEISNAHNFIIKNASQRIKF